MDQQNACNKNYYRQKQNKYGELHIARGLTKKAEPPPTRSVDRDSGTDRAIGGWLQRLVRPLVHGHKL
jgi:hypothetical protein